MLTVSPEQITASLVRWPGVSPLACLIDLTPLAQQKQVLLVFKKHQRKTHRHLTIYLEIREEFIIIFITQTIYDSPYLSWIANLMIFSLQTYSESSATANVSLQEV